MSTVRRKTLIDVTEFGAGLGIIAVQVRHPLDTQTIDAYHMALGLQTDPQEWRAFCGRAAALRGWRFFPGVVEIQDALRAYRGDVPLAAEAVAAYERVMSAGIYAPEGGRTWNYRAVRESCGAAAAEAWLASGGSRAWESTYHEHDRRETFVAAYQAAVRDDSSAKLLPPATAEPPKALPPAPPTESEAAELVGRIRREALKRALLEGS